MTNIRVSQQTVEALLKGNPNIHASQMTVEVLTSLINSSSIRASQVVIEVLGIIAVTPSTGRVLGPPVQMV